jgi:spore germination cell wall hydrolase CwlJ-like protein
MFFFDWFWSLFDKKTAIKPLIVKQNRPIPDITGIQSASVVRPEMVQAAKNLSDMNDLEVVARTIWGEARNQGLSGMTAVGCVIQNRVKIGGWFGGTPREVCLKPYQFSCWNKDDPNRAKLLSVTSADPQYQNALSIANSVLTGTLKDITGGSDSYQVTGTNAFWARNLKPVASIGSQDFYVTRQA